jgi:hypothetical protein
MSAVECVRYPKINIPDAGIAQCRMAPSVREPVPVVRVSITWRKIGGYETSGGYADLCLGACVTLDILVGLLGKRSFTGDFWGAPA